MTAPINLGFTPFLQDYAERGQTLSDALDSETKAELADLNHYRLKEYWQDLRLFARQQAAAMLGVDEDSEEAIALATATADLALRMCDKFMLPMAEILTFGGIHGQMPAKETASIIPWG